MANTGQPGSNGSQFFFVYGNSQLQGDYSLWGRVIEGMDIVKKVAAAGDDGAFAAAGRRRPPEDQLTFNTVTVGPVTEPTDAAGPTPAARRHRLRQPPRPRPDASPRSRARRSTSGRPNRAAGRLVRHGDGQAPEVTR